MIRVGLCDDDSLVRHLLADTLTADDIEVVVTCGSGEEAVGSDVDVDVWLVDLRMPGIDGRETARRLREAKPVKVIILTAFGDDNLADTLEAGATAYLHKDTTPGQLRQVVRTVHSGLTVVSPGVAERALSSDAAESLLDGIDSDFVDRRIVQLMSAGHSYEEIAAGVKMSVSGTKKRAARLMAALGVGSRAQLVAKLHGLRA